MRKAYSQEAAAHIKGFSGDASGKEPTCQCKRQDLRVRVPGRKDPLEEGMATRSSILAWRVPCRGAWRATVHGVTQSLSMHTLRAKRRPYSWNHRWEGELHHDEARGKWGQAFRGLEVIWLYSGDNRVITEIQVRRSRFSHQDAHFGKHVKNRPEERQDWYQER